MQILVECHSVHGKYVLMLRISARTRHSVSMMQAYYYPTDGI